MKPSSAATRALLRSAVRPISDYLTLHRILMFGVLLLLAGAAFAVPSPVNDSATVQEDSVNNVIDVASNDGGGAIASTATLATGGQASNGTAVSNGDGTFNYTPNADYFGGDGFVYEICDAILECATANVTITVNNVNDSPTANPDSITVPEDSTNNNIDVLANDDDPDGGGLSVTSASAGNGGVTVLGNSTVRYAPNPNFSGSDTINYSIEDSSGDPSSSTVAVTVTPANDPPVAQNQNVNTIEDTAVGITLVATDVDLDTLTYSIVQQPSSGVLSGSPPSVTYTPNPNFSGNDSFTFRANDGSVDSNVATVSISVGATNDPPVAQNQNVNTDEDTPVGITLVATDDDGDTLTYSIAQQPSNGVLSGAAPNVTYTPNANFSGNDSFTFFANDGTVNSNTATVSISIGAINDPPVAQDQPGVTTDEDTPVGITLVATDDDGDALTYSIVRQPADGTLSGSPPNVTYTPNENFNGFDSFTFLANDGTADSNTATVTISVASITDAPTAVNDGPEPALTIDEGGAILGSFNVLTNDTNPETNTMTAVVALPPANAIAFILNSDGTFNYTHDGSETIVDSFTYRASNGELSNVATVTITINPVNDAPAFVGVVPPGLTTPEDTSLTILTGNLVIDDPDNVPTDLVLTLDPVLPVGANYTLAGATAVTPNENFNGQLMVRATVSDGLLSSASFLIPVDVISVNDAPTLVLEIEDQGAVEGTPFNLDISGNFTDADGEALNYTATWSPAKPPNINFNGGTGVFSGTPQLVDADPPGPVYSVTVTALDLANEMVADTFEFTISALGRANLGLTISVTPASALPNEQLRWTFASDNPIGPAPGENVELTGRFIGNGLSVIVEGGAPCSVTVQSGSADFVCTIGTLPVGITNSINLTTTTNQVTEVVAFGMTEGTQTLPIDPNLADNSGVQAVGVGESFSLGAVQFLGTAAVLSVTAGDIDGDGLQDLVVGTRSGRPVQVFIADVPRESCQCQRDFRTGPISIPDSGGNEGVALADFDNNGTLDLVIANGGGQPDTVWTNDGAGNFVLEATLQPSNANDVAVGDFNNDGAMDIAIAAASPNPVYFGDGNGGFGIPVMLEDAVGGGLSFGVAVLDGNTSDDIVFANVGSESHIWTYSGGTSFTIRDRLSIGDAVSVAAEDLNNDFVDDLVFGRVPAGVGDVPSNPVLINNGDGTFGNPSEMLGISPTSDVLIGDVNEDGAMDIVFVNASGVHQIWTAASGSFQLHGEQIIDLDAVAGVLTDLGFADNGDPGGVDLALGGASGAGASVYLNDSFGNLGLGDAVPPVITLIGEASVSIASGTAYTDSGATASDNIDESLIPIVTNNVNTAVVGNYTVTYNVTDFAGNAAAPVVRTVNVTPATGRGGGGGGALGYWALVLLVGVQLLVLMQARTRSQRCRIRISKNTEDK